MAYLNLRVLRCVWVKYAESVLVIRARTRSFHFHQPLKCCLLLPPYILEVTWTWLHVLFRARHKGRGCVQKWSQVVPWRESTEVCGFCWPLFVGSVEAKSQFRPLTPVELPHRRRNETVRQSTQHNEVWSGIAGLNGPPASGAPTDFTWKEGGLRPKAQAAPSRHVGFLMRFSTTLHQIRNNYCLWHRWPHFSNPRFLVCLIFRNPQTSSREDPEWGDSFVVFRRNAFAETGTVQRYFSSATELDIPKIFHFVRMTFASDLQARILFENKHLQKLPSLSRPLTVSMGLDTNINFHTYDYPRTVNTWVQTGCWHLFPYCTRPRSIAQLHRSLYSLCCSYPVIKITSTWLPIPFANSTPRHFLSVKTSSSDLLPEQKKNPGKFDQQICDQPLVFQHLPEAFPFCEDIFIRIK